MNNKLDRYYNYIVNDMVNQTTIDNENRTIRLPFPPFFNANSLSNEDKPIPMIQTESSVTDKILGSGTLYNNMKDLYGLEDHNEIFKVLMMYRDVLVKKSIFVEDYLNNVADDILNNIEKERNYLVTPFGKFYVNNFRKNTIAFHDTSYKFIGYADSMGYTSYAERKYLFDVLSEKILNKFHNE